MEKIIYRYPISLGRSCQPALHLTRNNLRVASFPLDWIISPFDTLCDLLKNEFRDFMNLEDLKVLKGNPHGGLDVLNTRNGILSVHDFKNEETFEEEYVRVRSKFERRISRLYDVLGSGEPVLFVRRKIKREEAVTLSDLFRSLFPQLQFTLLCIDDTEEIRTPWKIPQVENRYLVGAPGEDADNPRYNGVWKKLFNQFHFDPEVRVSARSNLKKGEIF